MCQSSLWLLYEINHSLIDLTIRKRSTFDAVYLDCLPRASDSVVIPDIERLEASIMFTIVL